MSDQLILCVICAGPMTAVYTKMVAINNILFGLYTALSNTILLRITDLAGEVAGVGLEPQRVILSYKGADITSQVQSHSIFQLLLISFKA